MKAKVLLRLLALTCLVAAPATAQVNYAVAGSTAYVTGSPNASGNIVIASSYNGYPVTRIEFEAFSWCTRLTNVTIPNSVTTIGSNAFSYCFQLASVTIPDSVTTIERRAFGDCSSLTNVTIGNSVTNIGNSAFSYCSALTSLTIPNSVTSIEGYAFSLCTGLTNVTMGNSVISIGDAAFSDCARLTSVTIPDSVTSFGSSAFSSCTSLMNVTIPNGVRSIRDRTFYRCHSLKSVMIPAGVTNIEAFAFSDCTALTNATIPNSVITVGLAAFDSCVSLANVTLPRVTNIRGHAFRECINLVNVTFPSVTNIGAWAFYNCAALTNVTFPDGLATIEDEAFRYCTSLASVTIPASVTTIGRYVFNGCSSLTNISVDAANFRYRSVDGVLFGYPGLIVFPAGRGGNYVIPNGVTSIEELAFSYCTRLTSVTIPDSVTSIGVRPTGEAAFSFCTSLTNFSVNPGNLHYSSLNGVLFDKAQTTLLAFPASLGGDYVIPSSVTWIREGAFLANSALTSLTIPAGVSNIDSLPSGPGLTSFSVDPASSVYSSRNGVLFNKAQTALLRFPAGRGGDYVIPGGVTTIGSAFHGCSNLTSLAIPNSVISMDTDAFSSCTSLTNFSVDGANSRYRSLDGVLFNKSQTWLLRFPAGRGGGYIMPDGVTFVDHYAFFSSTGLTSVTIPDSVDSFGISAFSFSTGLTNITFLGSAPYTSNSFENVGMSATVYYYYGTTGWGPSYDGLPTVMLGAPASQVSTGTAGVKQGGFGFTVAGVVDQTIVVEGSTNLVTWQPVWTNTLSDASANFVDPQWLNHPRRFYRMRSN